MKVSAPHRGWTSGRATPSPRPNPYAAETANPAGRHLSFAEICPDDRGQLSFRPSTAKGCRPAFLRAVCRTTRPRPIALPPLRPPSHRGTGPRGRGLATIGRPKPSSAFDDIYEGQFLNDRRQSLGLLEVTKSTGPDRHLDNRRSGFADNKGRSGSARASVPGLGPLLNIFRNLPMLPVIRHRRARAFVHDRRVHVRR
jgi:hypothetical protein